MRTWCKSCGLNLHWEPSTRTWMAGGSGRPCRREGRLVDHVPYIPDLTDTEVVRIWLETT